MSDDSEWEETTSISVPIAVKEILDEDRDGTWPDYLLRLHQDRESEEDQSQEFVQVDPDQANEIADMIAREVLEGVGR